LRYYNGLENEIEIALVEGSGEYRAFYDAYYDTETIATTEIKILKVLEREEIIKYAKTLNELRLCKFIRGYKLNEEEKIYFSENYSQLIKDYINYYQYDKKDIFVKKLKKGESYDK